MRLPRSFGKPRKPRLFLVRRVVGDSMLPLLKPGRIVVAFTRYMRLRPGDIVCIHHDGLEKVKRIRDIAGDHVFVVGDNGEHSTDSRSFGWLHSSAVIAKVVWPASVVRPRK